MDYIRTCKIRMGALHLFIVQPLYNPDGYLLTILLTIIV